MRESTSGELLTWCVAKLRQGRSFQDVWDGVLSGSPLVGSKQPYRRVDGQRVNVEVVLTTGERLVYEPACGEIHLVGCGSP